jgi:hypothetical protein
VLGYARDTVPAVDLAREPFACVLHDPFETTLILRSAVAETLPPALSVLDGRRVILLEGQLADDLHGFMAVVSGALAERGLWLLAVGAATRDHLLVADADLDDALDALRRLAGREQDAP